MNEVFDDKHKDKYIYEDDMCIALKEEKRLQAPVHFLVVPKTPLSRLCEATEHDEKVLGHLLQTARQVALETLGPSGYHMVVDEDFITKRLNAVHVFGRALHHMVWPTGPGAKL